MRSKSRAVLAAVSAGVAGAVLLGASPASAHDVRAPIVSGGVQLGFAEVYNNHTWLAACDTRADGVGVYARGWLNTGEYMDVNDSDGSSGDCGRASAPSGKYFTLIQGIARNGAVSGRVQA
ncbi:hypothetical protein [Krasilnikovia sp. MM14-A1259]|uniref:hypothetical protein n=1 Tax=Krasilnikovia sp. MM14-A1259 TaxID=3373539 RepID=UPI00399D1552